MQALTGVSSYLVLFPYGPRRVARNPEWSPTADYDPQTWVEAVEVASKGRLMLPAVLRRRLGWAMSRETMSMLAVIDPEGSAELMPWQRRGEIECSRVAKALEQASIEDKPTLAVAAADRFLRMALDSDGRAILPFNLAVHLGTNTDPIIWAVATGERLWLWSHREWQASRASRFQALIRAVGQSR